MRLSRDGKHEIKRSSFGPNWRLLKPTARVLGITIQLWYLSPYLEGRETHYDTQSWDCNSSRNGVTG